MTTRTDNFESYNGSSVSLYNVAIDNTAPNTDELLTATSTNSAEWIEGITDIKLNSGSISVNNNTPNEDVQNVLTASSSTTANWKAFSNNLKNAVVAATTEAITIASINDGNVIDGITLSTGDRILVKDNGNNENGIYDVNASGGLTRSSDLLSGVSAYNIYVFVSRGTINKKTKFYCSNIPSSDIVGTDTLIFQVSNSAGNTVFVNNTINLREAIDNGASHIKLISGDYNFDSLPVLLIALSNESNILFEGLGDVNVIQPDNSSLTSLVQITNCSNITFRNINFNFGGSDRCVRFSGNETNITFENCNFTSSLINFNKVCFEKTGTSLVDGVNIINCNFDLQGTNVTAISFNGNIGTGVSQNILISNCTFSTATCLNHIISNANNMIIKECIFNSTTDVAINIVSNNNTFGQQTIISDCIFNSITNNPIELTGTSSDPVIVSNCIFDSCPPILANNKLILNNCHFNNQQVNALLLNNAESSNSIVTNNIFNTLTDNFSIVVETNNDHCIISENAFQQMFFSNGEPTYNAFITFTNMTTSENTRILRNNACTSLSINDTSQTIIGNFDVLTFDLTTSVQPLLGCTLTDISWGSTGHICSFKYIGGSTGYTIVPNSRTISPNNTNTSWTRVELLSIDETITLQWTGNAWKVFNVGTGTIV